MNDCASRHDFHVGDDFTVGCHDGTTARCPVAGLSLLMFLALHDVDVQSGESTLTIPSLEN